MATRSNMLWLPNSNTRIFGWTEILEEWNETLEASPYVTAVVENMRAATNPNGVHSPTLSQFMTYLNNEQDGIKWFLHECLAIRWLWNDIRIDYVRGLVNAVQDLDSQFPEFPGSPSCTVREFVQSNLNYTELDYVSMMPALVPLPNAPRRSSASASASPSASASASASPSAFAQQQQQNATPLHYPSGVAATFGSPPRIQRRPSHAWNTFDISPVLPTLSERFAAAEAEAEAETKAHRNAQAAHLRKTKSMMIRLIRSDGKEKEDDVVHINPSTQDDGSFHVRYNDNHNDSKLKMRGLSYDGVLKYLSNFLRLVAVDEMPFESVQFSFPTLPTIIVKPENLTSQTRDLVYDTAEMVMQSWPVNYA